MIDQRIGFIGAGRMAAALARGFLRAELTTADRLLASDVDGQSRRRFAQTTSAPTTDDNSLVADRSDVIFLAVKPRRMAEVAEGLRGKIADDRLLVSIAAGIRLTSLAQWFGAQSRLVRVMPNNPCLVGHGASAYCLGRRATAGDGALVGRLLGALGSAWLLEEKQMDAATGLSGSGPAFVYRMIETLGEAGARLGLPPDVAASMAAQTVRGAAEMVLATGLPPAELVDSVASPGGTTIAGLQALESGGFRATLISAVEAAARRSMELGASNLV
ncbi:MAG: pyrroline-5-carboxylate reductase [Planctomycetes bacterium]|nr:pyrroline-5-carboxylate reductase [Planctomycetota bacterium]